MRKLLTIPGVLFTVLFVCNPCFAEESMDAINVKYPSSNLITAGQPSKEDFKRLKEMGVSKIISLRPETETEPFDEKQEAEMLGIAFERISVSGAPDLTLDKASQLENALQGEEKVFIHCASGNRVGALLAIKAKEIEGKSAQEALEFGEKAGLSSLRSAVKTLVENESVKTTNP